MPRDPLRTPDAHVSPLAVCTCGYDLTGLPEDAAAKCPECGAVISELPPPRPPWRHRILPATGLVSPAIAAIAGLIVLRVKQLWSGGYLSPIWLVAPIAVVFLGVSLPIAYRVVSSRAKAFPERLAAIALLAVFPACLVVNAAAFVAIMYAVMVIDYILR
jgi:hypothetical protein